MIQNRKDILNFLFYILYIIRMRCLTYWVFLLPCMPHALNKWQSADHRAAWDSQQANPHHLRAHLAADRHGGSVQVFSDFCMSDYSLDLYN